MERSGDRFSDFQIVLGTHVKVVLVQRLWRLYALEMGQKIQIGNLLGSCQLGGTYSAISQVGVVFSPESLLNQSVESGTYPPLIANLDQDVFELLHGLSPRKGARAICQT